MWQKDILGGGSINKTLVDDKTQGVDWTQAAGWCRWNTDPGNSECPLWTCPIPVARELVRNAGCQAPPQTGSHPAQVIHVQKE